MTTDVQQTRIRRADRLRALRNSKGFTQETFAHRLGTDRISVNRWETGRVVPGTDWRARIADVLGEDAFSDDDDEESDLAGVDLDTMLRRYVRRLVREAIEA